MRGPGVRIVWFQVAADHTRQSKGLKQRDECCRDDHHWTGHSKALLEELEHRGEEELHSSDEKAGVVAKKGNGPSAEPQRAAGSGSAGHTRCQCGGGPKTRRRTPSPHVNDEVIGFLHPAFPGPKRDPHVKMEKFH